jgi:hypothetical protein
MLSVFFKIININQQRPCTEGNWSGFVTVRELGHSYSADYGRSQGENQQSD